MIFGNLLNRAFRLIPTQSFQYCAFAGKTINNMGVFVNSYAEPMEVNGSIQALEQSQYEQLGLDFEKNYRIVYAPIQMKGLDQQETPDKLIFDNQNWKVVRNTPWFNMDGWCGVVVTTDEENEAENA